MKLQLISVGLKHSGNLGALARVCDNFDAEKLILVDPQCEIDDHAYEKMRGKSLLQSKIKTLSSLQELDIATDLVVTFAGAAVSKSIKTVPSLEY